MQPDSLMIPKKLLQLISFNIVQIPSAYIYSQPLSKTWDSIFQYHSMLWMKLFKKL